MKSIYVIFFCICIVVSQISCKHERDNPDPTSRTVKFPKRVLKKLEANKPKDTHGNHKAAGLNGCVPKDHLNITNDKFSVINFHDGSHNVLVKFNEMHHHPNRTNLIYKPGYFLTNKSNIEDWDFIYNLATFNKDSFAVGVCDENLQSIKLLSGEDVYYSNKSSLLYKGKQQYPPRGIYDCEAKIQIPVVMVPNNHNNHTSTDSTDQKKG